ncbi:MULTISPECIES: ATP-grasp domain-containing protein [unclassified Modestobacter]
MAANVFVLGMDDLNAEILDDLPEHRYRFHGLLTKEELIGVEDIDLPAMLDRAQTHLEAFDGPIDAIIGYWDFPVSSMVPILCRRYGVPGPSLEAVTKCEHKYWSRLEQRKAIDEVPGFALVDVDGPARLPAELSYPVWLKPVKSVSSEMAFRVADDDQLAGALAEIREGIGKYAEPFEFVLDQLDELPSGIAEVGARVCLAEEAAVGRQVTVEGYRTAGRSHVYGIVDSLHYPGTSSFLRYQYPSQLPAEVQRRMATLSERVIDQIGLEQMTFNIEYFWDPETGHIRLLEVNPRHSQSHARLFEHVDGISNHELLVELALGQEPAEPHGDGAYGIAGKCFLRAFDDALVTRAPSPEDVARVEREVDGVTVEVVAEQGHRLSELAQQDSYSYELARLFIGAEDEAELEAKYDQCVRMLPFEFEEAARG